MNQMYEVKWETQIGPGSTFYNGVELTTAEDDDHARMLVQYRVWKHGFRDYSMNHIVITRVTEVNS